MKVAGFVPDHSDQVSDGTEIILPVVDDVY